MKVYLDNCCYNRPYDDQSYLRISLESQAKLYVQHLIRATGVKAADACHVACAEFSGCDYFLTTDDRILKYKSEKTTL